MRKLFKRGLFRRNRKGFTMAELLAVTAVIGMITTAVTPAVLNRMDSTEMAAVAGPYAEQISNAQSLAAAGTNAADTAVSDVSLAAEDTGLVVYGVPILVYPSGAGEVVRNEILLDQYIATANPGYAFVGWSWRRDRYVDANAYSELKNSAADDPNRSANIGAPAIKFNGGAFGQYLVALFEQTGDTINTPTSHSHEWGPTTYKWAADYSSCTAVSKCSNCDEEDKVKAKEVEKTETAATCTEGGSITYTAVFKKTELNTSITVETLALGHEWGEWTPDAEQDVETRVCTRCGKKETRPLDTPTSEVTSSPEPTATPEPIATSHVHTPAEAVIENETPATCTAGGSYESVVYCSDCKAEISRKTVSTAPLGHTGGTATCKQRAVCDRCQQEYGDLAAHQYERMSGEFWEEKVTEGDKTYSVWGHYEVCAVCEDKKQVEDGREEIEQ